MSFAVLKDAVAGQPTSSWTRFAVRADGRRAADHAVAADIDSLPRGAVIVLDHAGPAASRWSLDRPVGSAVSLDPISGRRSTALDDDQWSAVLTGFGRASDVVRAAGGRVVVAVDDDGLLHTALSPLSSIPTRRDRVLTILAACAPCDVLLVIEDLAPRGLDPTAGIAFARDAVLITNAKRLYATAGTAWLPPLRDRKKGRSVDIEAHDLASAAWAVGRVDVEVYGVVRTAAPLDLVARKARQFGLAGFIVDERAAPQTPTTTPTSAPDPFESR